MGWLKDTFRPRVYVGAGTPFAIALREAHADGVPRGFRVRWTQNGLLWETFEDTQTYLAVASVEADRALTHARGRVLDVGAGAGRHTLALEARGFEVTAIDVEPMCVELMRGRGVRDARLGGAEDFEDDAPYDTVLLLGGTVGLLGTLERLIGCLDHLRSLLASGGRLVISAGPFEHEFDAAALVEPCLEAGISPFTSTGQLTYRHYVGDRFDWLHVDEGLLVECARRAGLEVVESRCEPVSAGLVVVLARADDVVERPGSEPP